MRRRSYQSARGNGRFVRSGWDEIEEIIAAANVYTIKTAGPDRVIGFSPIPAMSMVSYAAGSRYLSLIGGRVSELSTTGTATCRRRARKLGRADRRAGIGRLVQLGLHHRLGIQRAADAHPRCSLLHRGRYKGTKTVAITPDYSEVAKLSDLWLHPKQGTDAALAMAMGHVILKEFFFDRKAARRLFLRLREPLHRPADAGAA